jgi:1,4-dihydroxy-2-naphthoyl-CoA hydrolase
MNDTEKVEFLNKRSQGAFPGLLGLQILQCSPGRLTSRLPIHDQLLAPNGYLHAAAVVGLADTSCGYGCFVNLPEGGESFTTIELKSNFIGTVRSGAITCEAIMVHGGKQTQVWDATVADEATGKTIALFRCSQMILRSLSRP